MSLTFRYELRNWLLKEFSADAEKILNGEIWRCLTALFLHLDPAHFFSNVFLGAVFFSILFEQTGVVKGWVLILLGGSLGNYINALFYKDIGHVSIGLSTAIFAAIGSFCSIKVAKYKSKGAKESFKVFLSGLALLGILGTGKGNIDLLAHFWGFFSGILIGFLYFFSQCDLSYKGLDRKDGHNI